MENNEFITHILSTIRSFFHSFIYSTNICAYYTLGIVLGCKDTMMKKVQRGFCPYKVFHFVKETDYKQLQGYALSHQKIN